MSETTSNHAANRRRPSPHESAHAQLSGPARCFTRAITAGRRGVWRVGLGLLVAGAWLAWVSVASGAERVYWANYAHNKISYANADGTGAGGDLNTTGATVSAPLGTAVDPATGRIYWANSGASKISYANLDGSGGGDLDTSGATVSDPLGLTVDPSNGRVYWANYDNNSIGYANADSSGGGGDVNTSGATVFGPYGVAVDPTGGRIYWANYVANSIAYANLDGSGGSDLNTTGAVVNGPNGVAFNPGDGRVYWANSSADSISYARVDVAGLGGTLNTAGATTNQPDGVAIDPVGGRVYWGSSTLSYAQLDGLGGGDLATTGATTGFKSTPSVVAAPVGAGAPVISGRSIVGMTLSCSKGSWAPDQPSSFYYRSPLRYAYTWSRDGAPIPGQTASTITPEAAGTYVCAVTGSNPAGATTQTSAPQIVSAAPPGQSSSGSPNQPPGAPGAPGTALSISRIRQAHATWVTRKVNPSPHDRNPPPYGTTFELQLNLASHLTLTFTGRRAGHRVSGRCRATTHRNRHAPACTRVVRFGSLIISRSAGRAQIRFYGQLDNRRLPAGRYTLTVTATAPDQHARVRTISFTIASVA